MANTTARSLGSRDEHNVSRDQNGGQSHSLEGKVTASLDCCCRLASRRHWDQWLTVLGAAPAKTKSSWQRICKLSTKTAKQIQASNSHLASRVDLLNYSANSPSFCEMPPPSPQTLVPFPSLLQKYQSLTLFMVETKRLICLLFELILQNRLSPVKCDCPILCVCSGKWHLSWISGILCCSATRSYCEGLFLASSQKTSCGKAEHLIWMLLR